VPKEDEALSGPKAATQAIPDPTDLESEWYPGAGHWIFDASTTFFRQ
jgi:hypothetical protein